MSSAARVPKLGGSSDIELTFRVPNERDDANTVELQVYLPANLPLLTVDVLPVPGCMATPAPILTLTNPTPASVATTTSGSSGTTEALAVAALAVAVLALLSVVLLLIRGRRRGDSGAAGDAPQGGQVPLPAGAAGLLGPGRAEHVVHGATEILVGDGHRGRLPLVPPQASGHNPFPGPTRFAAPS